LYSNLIYHLFILRDVPLLIPFIIESIFDEACYVLFEG